MDVARSCFGRRTVRSEVECYETREEQTPSLRSRCRNVSRLLHHREVGVPCRV